MEQSVKYSPADATVATQYFYHIAHQRNTADIFCVKYDYLLAEYGQSKPLICSTIQRTSESLSVNRC